MISPSLNLVRTREKLGLIIRDVETESERLGHKHNNDEYLITINRLSDFETKEIIPGIHHLYSLAIIYPHEFGEMLSWYGVELDQTTSDLEDSAPPRTHLSHALPNTATVEKPVRMDPILPPGSFIQVDNSWNTFPTGGWRSEYARPIDLIKTQERYTCSWCSQSREELILVPHPQSPVPPTLLPAKDAEIVG